MECPQCQSMKVVKNGRKQNGKQRWVCKECGRQFVENPQPYRISDETKALIDKLLLERISLAGMVRVTGVSLRWLQYYINKKYAETPQEVTVRPKKKGKLTLECDELWSFVWSKNDQQWVWLALDRDTREIVGCAIGPRTKETAQQLWDSLPPVYRQCAVCYSDFWDAYARIIPGKRHRPVSKKSGQTNHIERLNNTFRQRIARLVRKSLSFSKKLENHIGAIWSFIHSYNASLNAHMAS